VANGQRLFDAAISLLFTNQTSFSGGVDACSARDEAQSVAFSTDHGARKLGNSRPSPSTMKDFAAQKAVGPAQKCGLVQLADCWVDLNPGLSHIESGSLPLNPLASWSGVRPIFIGSGSYHAAL
jgi:hypothetical protein